MINPDDVVRDGLRALVPHLTQFVRPPLEKRYGPDFRHRLSRPGERPFSDQDPRALIRAALSEWETTFRTHAPTQVKQYLHMVRDVANRHAHHDVISTDEVHHALVTMRLLATSIGGDGAGPEFDRLVSRLWPGQSSATGTRQMLTTAVRAVRSLIEEAPGVTGQRDTAAFINRFIEIRPFAYHVSQRANLARLSRTRHLFAAAELIRRSGEPDLLRVRRGEPRPINVDGELVVLQDQKPLVFANAELASDWNEGDFVEFLNQHVFFWPGGGSGPKKYGERLLSHYEPQSPAVVRAPTASLLAANPELTPLFCAFNSGAPRMQNGRRVRRDRDLFQPAVSFSRPPSGAIELTFRGTVALPPDAEFAAASGAWAPLEEAAV